MRVVLVIVVLLFTCGRGKVEGKEKKGFCPPRRNVLVKCYEKPQCKVDGDCPERKKCCLNACGKYCLDPVKTKCESFGGECKHKDSSCGLEEKDDNPVMCNGKNKVCYLPEKDIGGICPIPNGLGTCVIECSNDYECAPEELCCSNGCGRSCMKPERPCALARCALGYTCIITGPNCLFGGTCSYGATCVKSGTENDAMCPTPPAFGTCDERCPVDRKCPGGQLCCSHGCGHSCMDPVCSSEHQDSLCRIVGNYSLYGSTIYDPEVQLPRGCKTRSGIPRGQYCTDPERVCLKKPILKLLECAPNACKDEKSKWQLVSLLNDDFNTTAPPRDFCDGNSVLFEKQKKQCCGFKKLEKMCQDVGGVFQKNKGSRKAYCTLP